MKVIDGKQIMYNLEKNAIKNQLKLLLDSDKLFDVEFYSWDIQLRIQHIYRMKVEDLTGYSVNRQLQDELDERRAKNNVSM